MATPTDALGIAHPPATGEARIVSLVPSLTELLFDLGLGGQVVGRTRYCVHPQPAVKAVPAVGGTKKISRARLLGLRPTHLLVNVDENPRELVESLAGPIPHIIVTHPNDPGDNPALYRLLGHIFRRQPEAESLCGRFSAALERLRGTVAELPPRRVLYLIWKAPWMTVSRDTYIARTLALVGWETLGDDPAIRYPVVELDARLLGGAELVLFASEPYAFGERDLEDFRTDHPLCSARLLRIDAEMVSWYGSRAIRGLDYLAELARRTAEA
ncbi:MAG: helical backbone metal receptor [Gammaproteobacteria bacterium]|nr:helical backbone metal receptor [Gammaproteobacteria bacterium]